MGGKNPAIVTENADLDRAAAGIARSAYGMGGQKCSALSRLYVHEKVADALLSKIEMEIDKIRIGDPTERATGLGPVVNKRAHESYARYVADLKSRGAKFRRGGKQPSDRFTEAEASRDYLVERGVPADAILMESEGRTTYESMEGVADLLEARGLRRVLVVTDPFHSLRSRMIADDVG